jgi:hypothetical protein
LEVAMLYNCDSKSFFLKITSCIENKPLKRHIMLYVFSIISVICFYRIYSCWGLLRLRSLSIKPIAKYILFLLWHHSKGIERLQNISIMHYSYTFQVCHWERHRNGCLNLLREIIFLFGIGFNGTSQRRYYRRKEEYLDS